MDKADIAILMSLLSAGFTAWQSYSSHITARVTKSAHARQPPTLELQPAQDAKRDDGWQSREILIRNHEAVGVQITELRARPKRGYVNITKDLRGPRDGFGGPGPIIHPPKEQRSADLALRLQSKGSRSGGRRGAADISWLEIQVKGIENSNDLLLLWEWADGQK